MLVHVHVDSRAGGAQYAEFFIVHSVGHTSHRSIILFYVLLVQFIVYLQASIFKRSLPSRAAAPAGLQLVVVTNRVLAKLALESASRRYSVPMAR